jgi:diguanylate cyclase (GGDEF)-like protein
MNALRLWINRLPLASKMALVMLELLLLVQLVGYGVVRHAVDRQVRAEVNANLLVGERVWQRQMQQNAQRLRDAAVVLAGDYGFRTAISSADVDTIASALENAGNRIGAGVVAFLDPSFRLVSAAQGLDEMTSATLQTLATGLAQSRDQGRIASLNRAPFLFVMVPVRSPLTVGWVLTGFPLNQTLVDDFQRLSSVHAVVLAGHDSQALELVVSSWPGESVPLQGMAQTGDTQWTLDGTLFAVRQLPLDNLGGEARVVLMRSIDEVQAPFVQLQWLLGLVTLGALLLFALASRSAAQRVTRPLNELTEVTRSLQAGHFDVSVTGQERGDEVGALARGFESMRASIAAHREEILRLAYWDRLTGLPNREQFRQQLVRCIYEAGGTGTPVAIITLNVDRFKHVNDVLGYAFGDELLKAVAARLRQQVTRAQDTVARLGGDEFAVLLSRTDAAGAAAMARSFTQSFEQALALGEQTVDLSASMGVACWPSDAPDADVLMSRAEMAMHAAKARTAGLMQYSPALDSSSVQSLSLLSDLREALQTGGLRLYLQPKLAVASGEVVAAEALVRWAHPERGLVPPMQFIPFAEQTGFVRQLTLWMFEEAARLWRGLQPAQGHLRLAINLSTRDLLDLEFPQRLSALMQRHGVQASGFCLEITESAIMDDPQRAESTLNRLAELGFKLSIDDFGTGYSSLAYLKRLPVQELKIDKSFVMGMAHDASDAKIVRSTVDLAHNLGLTVVAEGVETQALLDALRDLHCDEAQGYHISKPMPASEFVAWRAAWQSRAR